MYNLRKEPPQPETPQKAPIERRTILPSTSTPRAINSDPPSGVTPTSSQSRGRSQTRPPSSNYQRRRSDSESPNTPPFARNQHDGHVFHRRRSDSHSPTPPGFDPHHHHQLGQPEFVKYQSTTPKRRSSLSRSPIHPQDLHPNGPTPKRLRTGEPEDQRFDNFGADAEEYFERGPLQARFDADLDSDVEELPLLGRHGRIMDSEDESENEGRQARGGSDSDSDIVEISYHRAKPQITNQSSTAATKRPKAPNERTANILEKRRRKEARIQKRKELQERALRQLSYDSSDSDSGRPVRRIMVNAGHKESIADIYLDRRFKQLKDHQIEGLQFLWKNIFTLAEEDEDDDNAGMGGNNDARGCILSHYCGLGKTLTTISFLYTLATEMRKKNEEVVNRFPSFHILIICPMNLVANWRNEFWYWVGREETIFGGVYVFENIRLEDRLARVNQWKSTGGIMIIGYDMFRRIVSRAITDKTTDGQYEIINDMRDTLITVPSLVVMDEAHKLKNPESGISKAISLIHTKDRIALTGTPLQNHLMEYYTMIRIATNTTIFGEPDEFRTLFEIPIEEASFEDASEEKVRRGKVANAALQDLMTHVVHRKDHHVLAKFLKPKTEMWVKVHLTEFQYDLYELYLNYRGGEVSSNRDVLGMNADLRLICTHPAIFRAKFESKFGDIIDATASAAGMVMDAVAPAAKNKDKGKATTSTSKASANDGKDGGVTDDEDEEDTLAFTDFNS